MGACFSVKLVIPDEKIPWPTNLLNLFFLRERPELDKAWPVNERWDELSDSRTEEILSALRDYVGEHEDDVPGLVALAYFHLCNNWEKGESEVLPLILTALNIDPTYSPAIAALARYHKMTKNPDRAEAAYKKGAEVIAIREDNPHPYDIFLLHNYAVFLALKKDFEGAAAIFEDIVPKTDIQIVHGNYGIFLIRAGDRKKAAHYLDEAMGEDDDPSPEFAYAREILKRLEAE